MANSLNLLTANNLLQVPFIKVKIGNYTFGVYDKTKPGSSKYPNYVDSLEVEKINGQVNKYSLNLNYQINESCDPNYFEKVFSSVSKSRDITFTYGDSANPDYLYKEEKATMLKVRPSFKMASSSISYNISAVSNSFMGLSGCYSFPETVEKPSVVIENILQDPQFGLQDLFTGMRNMTLVSTYGLIPHNDVSKNIKRMDNISVIDYLRYLVELMSPDVGNSKNKSSVYILTFVDDTTGVFGGSYFKITMVDSKIEHPEAYQLDIGFANSNIVLDLSFEDDETYSLLYDYQAKLHPENYVERVNSDGDIVKVFAQRISSKNEKHETDEENKSWWAKVTEFPIKCSITLKGLLRPAVLMSYVRLNILFYGKKHIYSGLYIVTKQIDRVNSSGYYTTLNLTRISGE